MPSPFPNRRETLLLALLAVTRSEFSSLLKSPTATDQVLSVVGGLVLRFVAAPNWPVPSPSTIETLRLGPVVAKARSRLPSLLKSPSQLYGDCRLWEN